MFDRAAATYDRTGVELFGPVAELLLEQVAPCPGERVRDVRTAHAVVPVRFSDLDHWYRWSWSTAQRGVWEPLAPDERARVRAEVEAHVRRSAERHCQPGFDQPVRVTWGRR